MDQTPTQRLWVAREWLEECRTGHEICRRWRQRRARRLPARILRIDGPNVKLESCTQDSHVRFVALSHCWGNVQPLKTVKANVERHSEEGIPIVSLPLTFRDAVHVTEELGMTHIWIDSLCIVQDDAEDWQREAANMAAVYESAELTIAADWGRDSTDGCFREHTRPLTFELRVPGEQEPSHRIVVRPKEHSLERPPLKTRKWALQESVLSSRTLKFSRFHMLGTCGTLSWNEEGSEVWSLDDGLGGRLQGQGQHPGSYTRDRLWGSIVSDYSTREITSPHDKVAALAGIISTFEDLLEDVSVVGLWRRDLPLDLLWETSSNFSHPLLDEVAVVSLNLPYWSWLAARWLVNRAPPEPYHWSLKRSASLIKILDVDISWTGTPMTSPLSMARIQISGQLLQIARVGKRSYMSDTSLSDDDDGDTDDGDHRINNDNKHDGDDNDEEQEEGCLCHMKSIDLTLTNGNKVQRKLQKWSLDQCVASVPRPLFCLLMFRVEHDPDLEEGQFRQTEYMETLVVMPEEDDSKFLRVGIAEIQKLSDEDVVGGVESDFVLV